MQAWMAFVSIIAIVAIVLVAGGLIAFIGHMIIGAFDNDRKTENKAEVIDYTQFKQLGSAKVEETESQEYDFEAINKVKAEKEKELLEAEKEADDDIFNLDESMDEADLEAIENRLKEENTVNNVAEETIVPVAEEPVAETEETVDEVVNDIDLENLLDEISTDVIEETKEEAQAENAVAMDPVLMNYHIDDILNETQNSEEVVEKTTDEIQVEEVAEEIVEDLVEDIADMEEIEDEDEGEEIVPDFKEELTEEQKEIESLKAQLAELNEKLEIARSAKLEVVAIDMTEEECVSRLEILEERLKNAKREYKINMKEYRPLKKVMNDLEKYQTKLRRKETIVAKKKVALYGVNNYVDIDKERAEKLANELELLDGLRLSVNHCEEVINANKDRYPILEHTNKILEDQIAHIEADIATTTATLEKIREQNGDEGSDNE